MRCGKWPQNGNYNRAYAAGAFPLNQIALKWYFSMHRWIKSKIRNVSGKIFVLRRALRRLVGGHTRAPTHMLRTFWMFNTTSKMAWWLNHAQHGCAMYNTSTVQCNVQPRAHAQAQYLHQIRLVGGQCSLQCHHCNCYAEIPTYGESFTGSFWPPQDRAWHLRLVLTFRPSLGYSRMG